MLKARVVVLVWNVDGPETVKVKDFDPEVNEEIKKSPTNVEVPEEKEILEVLKVNPDPTAVTVTVAVGETGRVTRTGKAFVEPTYSALALGAPGARLRSTIESFFKVILRDNAVVTYAPVVSLTVKAIVTTSPSL